jgi:hypothetical protein
LFDEDSLDDALVLLPQCFILGQEKLTNAVMAGIRQIKAEAVCFRLEKHMRNLHENPGSVACERVRPYGAAMLEIKQNFQPVLNDLVAFFALDVGHETESAGIVLI